MIDVAASLHEELAEERAARRASERLVAALSALAAAAARDPEAALDALQDHAGQLLAADDVAISLADGRGGFVRRRESRLAAPGAAQAGTPAIVDPFVAEAIAIRGPVVIADVHGDPATPDLIRQTFPLAASALIVPLVADSAVLGIMTLRWLRHTVPGRQALEAAETLAHQAAVAIMLGQRARLDGTVKTIRRVAHEMNNRLTTLVAYGELLGEMLAGEDGELAGQMAGDARRAADLLHRLQRVARFEETEFGGQVMLDVEAATRPD